MAIVKCIHCGKILRFAPKTKKEWRKHLKWLKNHKCKPGKVSDKMSCYKIDQGDLKNVRRTKT